MWDQDRIACIFSGGKWGVLDVGRELCVRVLPQAPEHPPPPRRPAALEVPAVSPVGARENCKPDPLLLFDTFGGGPRRESDFAPG